jgi:hypothetical protein
VFISSSRDAVPGQAPSRGTHTAVPSATTGAPAARCNSSLTRLLVGVLASAKLGEHVGRVLVAYSVPFVLGDCSLVPRAAGGVEVDRAHHGAMSAAFAAAGVQDVPFERDLARTERWPAPQSPTCPRSGPWRMGWATSPRPRSAGIVCRLRGAPSADQEGWVAQARKPSLDAAMATEDTLAVMVAGPAADNTVVPFHAQVHLFDPGVEDAIPEWTAESLEQGVAAGPSGLSILTRADFERRAEDLSRVRVRVWVGSSDLGPSSPLVYEGELKVGGDGVVIGSVVGNELHAVAVPMGVHRVRVYAEPKGAPEVVDVVLEALLPSC